MSVTTPDHLAVPDQRGGLQAVALTVWIVAWCICATAVAVYLAERPSWSSDQWFFVVDLADGLVYAPTAWLLLSRSRHLVGWLIAVTAVGGSLAALGFQWSQFSNGRPDVAPLGALASMQNWAWIPGTLSLVCIIPWLVREGPLDRTARWMVGLGATLTASFVVARVTDPFPWPDGEPFASLPVRSEWWGALIERSFRWQVLMLVALGLIATADVLRRRAAGDGARVGLSWLAAGTLLVTMSFVPLVVPEDLAAHLPVALTPLMHLASQLFYPAAVLVVVLGQRLWGVDLAMNRAVTWGLLTAVLTFAYVVVVSMLGLVLPDSSAAQQVVATAFVAAGFQPVKRWVQRRVDQLVRGDAADPARLWQHVGRQFVAVDEPAAVLDQVLSALTASLRLGAAMILAEQPDGPVVLAPQGARPGSEQSTDSVSVPLPIGGRQVGSLLVIPRIGERLDAVTVDSVENLAPIIAATVQLSLATEELSRSRSRVLAARDEERRRLRRELHDGLGPALAGIGLALQASRNLVAIDPVGANALIEQVIVETDQRVDMVRTMAHDLLPPSLEGEGLVPALDELARLHQGAGLDVRVDATSIVSASGILPSEISTAIYAIATESVRNAARHSSASRCSITVAATGEQIVLEVRDDGLGFAATSRKGVGLTSMREWAEGVGGEVVVRPVSPSGTCVRATLPLRTRHDVPRTEEVTS